VDCVYNVKCSGQDDGQVKGAQLKLAATTATAKSRRDAGATKTWRSKQRPYQPRANMLCRLTVLVALVSLRETRRLL
jgi:hypothetical protein